MAAFEDVEMPGKKGPGSIDEMYRMYAKMVYVWLLSLTRKPELAEELCQETFYQAMRTLDRYDPDLPARTWLFGIAKNVHRTWLRKNPPHTDLEELAPSKQKTTRSAEDEYLSSSGEAFLSLIASLGETQRQVVYLRVEEELSFAEIGQQMGKTENWARVTFYRAKQALKKEMENS